MKRSLILALAALVLVAPGARAAPGEVTAVSVFPGPGRALVIIDVRGSVGVQDFTLRHPARIVVDVSGARLRTSGVLYDGQNRGGILNIRYAQFRPDVVRIVVELESLKDYQLEYADDAIRISLGADQSFTAWSSAAPADYAPAPGPTVAAEPALPPPVAPAPPPVAQSQQPTVTVSYDRAEIADVVAGFAELSGRSIVIGKDVTGLVTAEVKNQPWDVAFRAILQAQGLDASEDESGIISVDSRVAIAERDSLERLETIIVAINYARASALVPIMQSVISGRGRVVADTGTNSLIITDNESRVHYDTSFISQLDIPTPQVSIQAKIIFVNRTNIEELGVKYDLGGPDAFFNDLVQRGDPASSTPIDTDGDGVPDAVGPTEFFSASDPPVIRIGGNALAAIANAQSQVIQPALQLIFSTAIGNFSLTSFVDALERVELADLQAEPLTSTSDNTEAYVLVGERTPVRVLEAGAQQAQATAAVDYIQTGIMLRVTPHVTANRQILMEVHAENSSIQAAPGDLGFTFQTQEAESQILVNDGQTAVIGGLTVTEVTVAKSGIPFLVDLPIVGGLFGFTSRRETRRDLLILVTPHIIDNPAVQSGSAQ